MSGGPAPDRFDPIYFGAGSWPDRVDAWVAAAAERFSAGNVRVVAEAITDEDSGLRVVVNIGVWALIQLLPNGRYLNLYEHPVIGGARQGLSPERGFVDQVMGLVGDHTYFGAVALGGAGVRYYGEFCLVIRLNQVDPNPQLFDRDSYDILIEPLADLEDLAGFVKHLRGSWREDRHAMVLMKVLPEVVHQRRLVTTGTVSDLILKDQEFIEVHLRPSQAGLRIGESRSFGANDIEELRESPDEVAVATRLREREADGMRLSDVEYEWLLRRECVSRVLGETTIRSRVVTQHGRGYQWR